VLKRENIGQYVGSGNGSEQGKEHFLEAKDRLEDEVIEAKQDGDVETQVECFVGLGQIYRSLASVEKDDDVAEGYEEEAGVMFRSAGSLISSGQSERHSDSVRHSKASTGSSNDFDMAEVARTPGESFDGSVKGYDELKESVRTDFVRPFAHRELFLSKNGQVPKGTVLYGPSGTGKSTMAEALAAELDTVLESEVVFMDIGTDSLKDSRIGETAKQVVSCFEKARELEPAVLFFDEIDAIAPSRSGGLYSETNEEVKDLTNNLLTEISKLDDRDIVVVGTTNLLQDIDPAIIEDHRLLPVEVPLPCSEDRREILEHYLEQGDPDWTQISLDYWVDRSDGLPGASLETMVRLAGNRAAEDQLQEGKGSVSVSDWHLEQVWDERGYDEKSGEK